MSEDSKPSVWAIADLHLSFGTANKSMDVFGTKWIKHAEKIASSWQDTIGKDDLVLIPGDISWGMQLHEAKYDLDWIGELPGTKVILRGNHDYWWTSLKKIAEILPPSIHIIQNNAFQWHEYSIAGARLWDSYEYNFGNYIDYEETPDQVTVKGDDSTPESREKIFVRELQRLELSLKAMDRSAKKRIAMTHYPPISVDLKNSRAAEILEKYHVDYCVFGHLHNVTHKRDPLFGTRKGVTYALVAADYLDFKPLKIY